MAAASARHSEPSANRPRFVAYERVSTARQSASGLGLEAQRKTIEDFATSRGAGLIARLLRSSPDGKPTARNCAKPST
jgi:hypothetical protein